MNTNKSDNYKPTYTIPPGATLEETLVSMHMSQSELAKRISRPEKTISEIINGVTSITPETAIQFERALGVSASFWNNLEKNHQEQKARMEATKKLVNEIDLVKHFPYKEMVMYGWVNKVKTLEEKVENLLTFFGVDSLKVVNNVMHVNYRKHHGKDIWDEAVAVWLRKGELDAIKIQTMPFDEKRLRANLDSFKNLSNSKITEFMPILQRQLAECGIALVFTPGLPKTYICGASRWLTPSKALIQLSVRGSFADIMWFTLYHEIGHILLHNKRERFIDIEGRASNELEIEADNFSSESLIPTALFQKFFTRNSINAENIKTFAKALNIHPGIVVGRLQHEQVIKFNQYRDLKTQYKWVQAGN